MPAVGPRPVMAPLRIRQRPLSRSGTTQLLDGAGLAEPTDAVAQESRTAQAPAVVKAEATGGAAGRSLAMPVVKAPLSTRNVTCTGPIHPSSSALSAWCA